MTDPTHGYTNNVKVGQLDDDEELVATIKRHPMGIIGIYFIFVVGLLAVAGIITVVIPRMVDVNTSGKTVMALALVIALIFMGVALIALTYVYWQNKMIITDKNITQVNQRSLFNREISQLSMANIEDVTSEKKGILQTMFNYGTMRVETAGERFNFHFEYCPNPDVCAKAILECREKFIEYNPDQAKRANPLLEGLKRG